MPMNITNSIVATDEANIETKDVTIKTSGAPPNYATNSTNDNVTDSIYATKKSNIKLNDVNIERIAVTPVSGNAQQSSTNQQELVFIVGGHRFSINRSTLAQKAPEFEAEFRNGNQFELKNVTARVFQVLLAYIEEKANQQVLIQNVVELLAAADNLKFLQLKEHCQAYLQTTLSSESAVNLLLLADTCNASNLKVAAFEFINANPTIMQTDEFKEIFKRPDLAQQLYQSKFNN